MSNANSNSTEIVTANLLRFAGYGLLLLSLSNFAEALIPPKFGQSAAWEFDTLGKVVGTSPVPIIALILIFYGESTARSSLGKNALKILSWFSLILSIFYVVMTLIGVSAAIRINNDNEVQASTVLSQQLEQFKTARENLKNTNDSNLLRATEFIERRSPNLQLDKSNLTVLRGQLETEINKNEAEIRARVVETKSSAFRQLIKRGAKSYFEALVSAAILFGIWSQTKWTRSNVKRKKKGSKVATSLGDVASAPTLDIDSDEADNN